MSRAPRRHDRTDGQARRLHLLLGRQATPGGKDNLPQRHYRGNVVAMSIARSRVTAQGQVSVPAEVRRKLGVGPGSLLEWDEDGNTVVVRRSGRYSSVEIHRALFGHESPAPRGLSELKEGIRRHVRARHARS